MATTENKAMEALERTLQGNLVRFPASREDHVRKNVVSYIKGDFVDDRNPDERGHEWLARKVAWLVVSEFIRLHKSEEVEHLL